MTQILAYGDDVIIGRSLLNGKKDFLKLDEEACKIGRRVTEVKINIMLSRRKRHIPVSYTHLDVYKRQHLF